MSSNVSTLTSARIASVNWPSHSAACGYADRADEHALPRVGEDADEAVARRALVGREARQGAERDARAHEVVAVGRLTVATSGSVKIPAGIAR